MKLWRYKRRDFKRGKKFRFYTKRNRQALAHRFYKPRASIAALLHAAYVDNILCIAIMPHKVAYMLIWIALWIGI